MKKELDYYLCLYNDVNNNQIVKPFFDDEKGALRLVAIVNVYIK